MSTFFILIVIMSSIWRVVKGNETFSYIIVDHCPGGQRAWQISAKRSNCSHVSSLRQYHCIRIWNYTLVETCLNPVSGQEKDGCPWLETREDKFSVKFERCKTTVSGCPGDSGSWFSSDQLYKFPGCFINPERIRNPTTTTAYTEQVTSSILSTSSTQDVSLMTSSDHLTSMASPSISSTLLGVFTRDVTSHETTIGRSNNIILYSVAGGAGFMFFLITFLIVAVICLWRKNKRLRISGRNVTKEEFGFNCPPEHESGSQYDSIKDVQISVSNPPSPTTSGKEKQGSRHVYDETSGQKDHQEPYSENNDISTEEKNEDSKNDTTKDIEMTEKYIPLERVEETSYSGLNDNMDETQESQTVTSLSDYEEPVSNKYEKLLPHDKKHQDLSGEKQNREYQSLQKKSSSESDSSQVESQ